MAGSGCWCGGDGPVPSAQASRTPSVPSACWCFAWHGRIPRWGYRRIHGELLVLGSGPPPLTCGRSSGRPDRRQVPPLPGRCAACLRLLRDCHLERCPPVCISYVESSRGVERTRSPELRRLILTRRPRKADILTVSGHLPLPRCCFEPGPVRWSFGDHRCAMEQTDKSDKPDSTEP